MHLCFVALQQNKLCCFATKLTRAYTRDGNVQFVTTNTLRIAVSDEKARCDDQKNLNNLIAYLFFCPGFVQVL